MPSQVIRVVVGAIVAIILLTAIGIVLTPATSEQSLTIGLVGGTLIAIVNWFLEEQKKDAFDA